MQWDRIPSSSAKLLPMLVLNRDMLTHGAIEQCRRCNGDSEHTPQLAAQGVRKSCKEHELASGGSKEWGTRDKDRSCRGDHS